MLKKKVVSVPEDVIGIAIKANQILPLELNIDLGRADLNELVGKLQDKINEIVKKVN